MIRMIKHSFYLCLALISPLAMSANYNEAGLVSEILISPKFSECAVALEGFSAPGTCGRKWLSFDCQGVAISKTQARAQLELAQMAYALEKPIRVWFSDGQLIDDRCMVFQASLSK